jgi:filamentous hemagglutinin
MTLRLQNLMLAMLLALTTLFVGFGTLSQNPTSGGYQLFERAASGISADIQLASLGNFAPSPETASEYANAPNRVPGGGLSAHESAGGHLIDRHVGNTSQELIDRANGVGGQRAPSGGVSSYSSVADAERHTSQVISARQADIDAYLANPVNRTAAFDVDIGQTTGQWVPKGGTASQPVTASRVVITPDASMPTGYRIITGHPVPQAVR